MFDESLVLSILIQIDDALETIVGRAERIRSADDFTGSPAGIEKLDSLCMYFMAVGGALKNLDKTTAGTMLSHCTEIDWKGVIGFRDILAHQYFDIDADQVFWICAHELGPLSATIKRMIQKLR